MLIIKLLRWILGYIDFRAYNGFADRFINLCTKNGIPLWNIRNVGGRISASTTIQGYLALRGPARKSGMKVRAIEKKGLIFTLKRNKKRWGILLGAAISVTVMIVLSQFVWSISVVGNTTVETDTILEAFEKYGVKVGVKTSKDILREATDCVISDLSELSWASVNQKGSVLVIEVRESILPPQMYDNSKPTNMIASEDGVILGIDILHGTPEVKIGSAVTKGDLLISGIVSHPDGSESVIHADGHVKALVKKKKTFETRANSVFKIEREKTRKKIVFFGIKIPLGTEVPETFMTEHKSFLESDKILLPLGIITEYGAEYSTERYEQSDEISRKIALYESALYVRDLLNYCEIKESHIAETTADNIIKYDFYAECEQEIGTLQEIYVEKTNDIA